MHRRRGIQREVGRHIQQEESHTQEVELHNQQQGGNRRVVGHYMQAGVLRKVEEHRKVVVGRRNQAEEPRNLGMPQAALTGERNGRSASGPAGRAAAPEAAAFRCMLCQP